MAYFPYRFASGHVSYATITGSSSYLLSNFPRQTDQPRELPWCIASYTGVEDAAFFTGLLSGGTGGNGLPQVQIALGGMTPDMVDYWHTTFLGALQSANFTMLIRDNRLGTGSEALVFQGTIHKVRTADIRWQSGRRPPIATVVPYRVTRCVYQAPP